MPAICQTVCLMSKRQMINELEKMWNEKDMA